MPNLLLLYLYYYLLLNYYYTLIHASFSLFSGPFLYFIGDSLFLFSRNITSFRGHRQTSCSFVQQGVDHHQHHRHFSDQAWSHCSLDASPRRTTSLLAGFVAPHVCQFLISLTYDYSLRFTWWPMNKHINTAFLTKRWHSANEIWRFNDISTLKKKKKLPVKVMFVLWLYHIAHFS